MTSTSLDRLDRIEAILLQTSDRLNRTEQLAERDRDDIAVLIEGQTQTQIAALQDVLAQNLGHLSVVLIPT